jgi:hypothetical protein
VVIQDAIPTPAANRIAVRAMHLGIGDGALDVFATATTSSAITGPALFSDVALDEVTAYTERDIGAFALRATPATQTSPVLASATAPPGEAGSPQDNLTTIGGSTMAGSAILGIYMRGSVVGSSAPQGSAFVVQTGSTTLAVTATGFSRGSGSFTTNGFAAGQTFTSSGFTNTANNGTWTVASISAGGSTGSTALASTPTGYVRTAGSFITDGFEVGDWVTAAGFANSATNGRSLVTGVTDLVLTVTKTTAPVTEAEAAGRSITGDQNLTVTAPTTVVEAAASNRSLLGPPRPAWVYIIDRHPR